MESNSSDSDEEGFFGLLSKKEWQISSAMKGSPFKCVCASRGLMSPSSAAYSTSINVDQGISQLGSNLVDSDKEIFFGVPSEKEPQMRSAMKGSPLNITKCESASSGLISPSPTACCTSINVDQGKPYESSQAGTAYSASGTFTDNSGLVEEPETSGGMRLGSKDPFIGDISHISDDTVVSRIVYDMSLSDSSCTGSSQRKNMRNVDLSTVDEYGEQGKVMTNLDISQFASKEQHRSCGCVYEDEYLTVRKLLRNLKIVQTQTFKSPSGDNIKANVPSLNLASVPNELVQESSFVHQNMHKSDGNTPQETELSNASSVASCGKRKISAKRKPIFPEDRDVMHSEGQGEGLPSKYSRSCPDISPSVPDKKVSHSVGHRSRGILAAEAVFSSPQLRKPHVPARRSKIPRRVTTPSKLHWDVVSPIGEPATQSPPRSHTRRGLSSPSSSSVPSHIVPSEVVQVHNEELMLEEVPEGEKSSPEGMERSDLTCSYSRSNTTRGQKK